MTKTTVRTSEELTEALNNAERGDIIIAIAAEPEGNDLDGIGLDILCIREGQFSFFTYNASMDSEDAEGDKEAVMEAFANTREAAQMEMESLTAAREYDEQSGRY